MAHQFNLNEPIIAALVAQLQAQMPAACATVNADVADGYTILNPVQVSDYMPPLSTLSGGGFPAIAVEDGRTEFQDDLVASVTGDHRITLVAFLSNPDPRGLAYQLRRYQQAILLAINYDRTYGGATWTTRLLGIDPGPRLEPASRPNADGDSGYLSWFAIDLECPRTEV